MTEDKLFVHDSGGPNECEDKSFVFELESEVRTEKSSTDGVVGWISVGSDGLATLVNANGIRDPGRLRLQVNKGKRTGDNWREPARACWHWQNSAQIGNGSKRVFSLR